MADRLDNSAPFDDDQGTRIAKEPTGAGAEAARGTKGEPDSSSQDHLSGYGGQSGEPKLPNDGPDAPRTSEK